MRPAAAAVEPPPAAWLVAAAFAAVYLVWGSTFLAIRVTVETLPPWTAAAVRHGSAGILLYAWTRWRGAARPSAIHWRSATILGALMLFGGNGGVMWAEQTVPSGIAALLIATVPLWMIVLPALRPGGARPRINELGGLALGFVGVWVLVDPRGGHVPPAGAAVLLLAAFCWALGSLYSRRAPQPASPLVATALQMLCGGGVLLLSGALAGEWRGLDPARVSGASLVALAYLVFFGSLVGFTAYVWLLRVSTPAKVATYAYVNPLVAVALGAAFVAEPLTPRVFLATALVVAAVVLTTLRRA